MLHVWQIWSYWGNIFKHNLMWKGLIPYIFGFFFYLKKRNILSRLAIISHSGEKIIQTVEKNEMLHFILCP